MKKIYTFLIFLALACVFPIIILLNLKERITVEMIFPLATVIIASLVTVDILNRKNPQYMRLFFWVFIYVMFGIAPIAQLAKYFYWREPRINAYSTQLIINSYLVIWIGAIAYEIGHLIQQKWNKKRVNSRKSDFRINNRTDILIISVIFILAIGVTLYKLSMGKDYFQYKDVSTSSSLEKFGTVGLAFLGLLSSYFPLYGTLLGITDLRNNKYSLLMKVGYTILVASLLLYLLITSNPISSSRWWLGTIYIALFLLFVGKKKNTPTLLAIGLPFLYIFVFYYLAIFRSEFHLSKILSSEYSIITNLIEGDFDSMQQILNAMLYVKYEGLTFGRQLMGVAFFWIPRALWPNKPFNTGEFIGRYFGYGYLNLSAPLWAEGYINFGIPGVFIFLFVWGIICGKLDFSFGFHQMKEELNDRKDIILFVLTGSQHLLVRGSLLVSTLYLLPPIIFVNLWFFIKREIDRIRAQQLRDDMNAFIPSSEIRNSKINESTNLDSADRNKADPKIYSSSSNS